MFDSRSAISRPIPGRFEKLAQQIKLEQQQAQKRIRTVAAQQPDSSKPGKPGRNTPCPCGSGLKYKKCCG
ncbi:MAG: SEC-C domain-containing protein [Candidatus Omnitrophica bacterium]|nr:SEC-C domain-containing protein [Candidatus Omnitrophota bacterium]